MIVIVAPEHALTATNILRSGGETVWQIGDIKSRKSGTPSIVIT